MRRIKLQEGRKVIYEGNGFCRVLKDGRFVERLQLERGDNLLEALGGLAEADKQLNLIGMKKVSSSTKLPAGKYYVGDLSYVIKGKNWDNYSDVVSKNYSDVNVIELDDGSLIAELKVAGGDGTYYGSNGVSYDVDSGTIGCIPIDSPLIDGSSLNRFKDHIVNFPSSFEVRNYGGDLGFGTKLTIYAGSEDEYDEYSDEDYDY